MFCTFANVAINTKTYKTQKLSHAPPTQLHKQVKRKPIQSRIKPTMQNAKATLT